MNKNATSSSDDIKVKTVKMSRPEPGYQDGPKTADVHQDEVESWKIHGWTVTKK
jgi:hypothetical protein